MSKQIKIDPYGFREYDARWLYEKDINKLGIENLGTSSFSAVSPAGF
jgi:phosphomannomutase/phosphoglucomutase